MQVRVNALGVLRARQLRRRVQFEVLLRRQLGVREEISLARLAPTMRGRRWVPPPLE